MNTIYLDFDNTITNFDILDFFIDNFLSVKQRMDFEYQLKANIITHDVYIEKVCALFTNLNISEDMLFRSLYELDIIDPHFNKFASFCYSNNIKIVILSFGFKQVIQFILKNYNFVVHANDYKIQNDVWIPVLLNKNKEEFITTPYPKVFIGDGISDTHVASKVDILFAKKGYYLEAYCKENSIKFTQYTDFNDIIKKLMCILKNE